GLYLVAIVFSGDRMLITNDDIFPMIEVDENYGNNLLGDFHWFMKLSYDWDSLRRLRPSFSRCTSATTFFLRIKLVQAAMSLQVILNTTNLGRLHHCFFRDNHENAVFILVCELPCDVRTWPLYVKWSPIIRVQEQMQAETSNKLTCMQQIAEKLGVEKSLERGLYLAYLKTRSTLDSVRVMVHAQMPGSLPCAKIRDVSNVTKEEWMWLHQNPPSGTTNRHRLISVSSSSSADEDLELPMVTFKQQIGQAAEELRLMLNMSEKRFMNSRIYDTQVVEVRDDLSFIILLSTANEVNTLSSPSELRQIQENNFIYLPVHIFEMLQHLSNNYQFMSDYSRVSISLESELLIAQQVQREAFTITEIDESKTRLSHLLNCQQELDEIWRISRWLVDVINCAKDRSYAGISLKSWLSLEDTSTPASPTTNAQDEFLFKIEQLATNDAYTSDSTLKVVEFKSSSSNSALLLLLPASKVNAIPHNVNDGMADAATIMKNNNINPITDSGLLENDWTSCGLSPISLIFSTSSIDTQHSPDHVADNGNGFKLYVPTTYHNEAESHLVPMMVVAFQLRPFKTTTCKDIVESVINHVKTCRVFRQSTLPDNYHQSKFQPSSGCLIWTFNGQQQILDEQLTAGELIELLTAHGGQIQLKWIKPPVLPLTLLQ
ncbi:unnamed protein product, partial [Didymodactylos carnosus]